MDSATVGGAIRDLATLVIGEDNDSVVLHSGIGSTAGSDHQSFDQVDDKTLDTF